LSIHRQLWLCLAPIGAAGEVVPAFMERRSFWLRPKDDDLPLLYQGCGEPPVESWETVKREHRYEQPDGLTPIYDAFLVKKADLWEPITGWEKENWHLDHFLLTSVNPVSCYSLLKSDDGLFEGNGNDFDEDFEDHADAPFGCYLPFGEGIGSLPSDTLAGAIEHNLLYAEGAERIEHRLARAAARRVEALNRYREGAEALLARRRAELMERWGRGIVAP
jgi:hypothetical protein